MKTNIISETIKVGSYNYEDYYIVGVDGDELSDDYDRKVDAIARAKEVAAEEYPNFDEVVVDLVTKRVTFEGRDDEGDPILDFEEVYSERVYSLSKAEYEELNDIEASTEAVEPSEDKCDEVLEMLIELFDDMTEEQQLDVLSYKGLSHKDINKFYSKVKEYLK